MDNLLLFKKQYVSLNLSKRCKISMALLIFGGSVVSTAVSINGMYDICSIRHGLGLATRAQVYQVNYLTTV